MIEYMYGAKKPRKDRYVAAIITPASPYYVHGLIDSEQVGTRRMLSSLGFRLSCVMSGHRHSQNREVSITSF